MTNEQIERISKALEKLASAHEDIIGGDPRGPSGFEGLAMALAGEGLRSPIGEMSLDFSDAGRLAVDDLMNGTWNTDIKGNNIYSQGLKRILAGDSEQFPIGEGLYKIAEAIEGLAQAVTSFSYSR